jgi:TldD protein
MVDQSQIEYILQKALKEGGDFAELFFEERDDTNICCQNGIIDGVKTKHIYGVGLYLLSGTKSVYVYSNNTAYESLLMLAEKASGILRIREKQNECRLFPLQEKHYTNPNVIVTYPSSVSYQDKVKVVTQAYQKLKSSGKVLQTADLNYFDVDRRIMIANSEGLLTRDRRITSRLRMGITCGDSTGSFYHWEDYTRPQGFEAFRDSEEYLDFAGDVVLRCENMRTAGAMKPGNMPVVLEAGACGTLWHESCGHTLEATAIAARSSCFVDKLGKKIASDKVTLIDDGTMPGYYGSDAIDDEGHRKQKNILIENGVLKSYLCDRLHGRKIGMESTGNGRRENYTFAPVARMTNTYLAAGNDDEEEMIRSVPEGLYVKSLGGGFGGMQFSIEVKEGFLIKNGQIDRQVKGIMLTGNGAEVIRKIDRVGRHVGFDGGGFCGAASGLVPVTSMQPMVRISEMSLG